MSELELLPPKADVNTDANLRIHLRVLIGVLYEMTKERLYLWEREWSE